MENLKRIVFWKKFHSAVSLTELLVGVVVASVLVAGIVQMMKSGVRSSSKTYATSDMKDSLSRFTALVLNDLGKAGSDPTGLALQAYIYESTCSGKLIFNYGINPEPADPGCSTPLGQIGILSYVAYDNDGDGNIDPEEAIDFLTVPALLRPGGEDYIVYQWTDDKVNRKNIGNPDTTDDDSSEVVLENVVSFDPKYFGYTDGVFGEISENSRYDDIREVRVQAMVHSGNPEAGYENPELLSSSPYFNYRTESVSVTHALLVRKEL